MNMAEAQGTLSTRLAQTRRRLFVGRDAEQALFADLLEPSSTWCLLWVFGPGGVGKTTLLDVFEAQAGERNIPVVRLDARTLPTDPDNLQQALQPFIALDEGADPRVMMLDTFEHLARLEGWLREQWLPQLPDNYRVVLSGRLQPASEWITDTGWGPLSRSIDLPYFSRQESQEYLRRRAVPKAAREQAVEFAKGSPLLLAMEVDLLLRRPDASLEGEDRSDLLRHLVRNVLRDVRDPSRRLALEAACIVYHVTRPLLAVMLPGKDVEELYAWLRALSYTESTDRGLTVHDLVREALAQELQQSDPIRYDQLARAAHAYIADLLIQETAVERESLVHELFYTNRDIEFVKAMFQPGTEQARYGEPARDEDWPAIREMVLKNEGEASLQVLVHWRTQQPAGLVAIRDRSQQLCGFMYHCDPELIQARDREVDTVADVAADYLAGKPSRQGKRCMFIRYWMDAQAYQGPSPVSTYVHAFATSNVLTRDLAVMIMVDPDDALHNQMGKISGHEHIALPDNPSTGPAQAFFNHDYLEQTASEWVQFVMAAIRGREQVRQQPDEAEGLSQGESTQGPRGRLQRKLFEDAVRAALKHYLHPDRLSDNPLLVLLAEPDQGGDHDLVGRLRELLAEQSAKLGETPKTEIHQKVLERTYLKPARDQQAAAEALNLSFSTYRRRLKEAVSLLQAELWSRLH